MPEQPSSEAPSVEAAQAPPAVRHLPWLLLLLAPAALLWLWASPATLQPYFRHPRAHARAPPPAQPHSAYQPAPAAGCTSSIRAHAHWAMANDQPPCLVRPTVLLFGDSLTERCMDPDGGWGAALAHHFSRKVDVANRGFGGYNSRWGLKLLQQVLAQSDARRVALLTIWFGANDAALPDRSAGRQAVPRDEFAANLGAMVDAARAAGIRHILLLTPPPVDDEARVKHVTAREGLSTPAPPDRMLAASAQYAAAVSEVGARLGVPALDMHGALQAHPRWRQELLSDGLHFTPAGSRAVWEAVRGAIEQHFPHLASLERMSNQMPWWNEWAGAADPDAFWAAALPELQRRERAHEKQQGQAEDQQQQGTQQQQHGGGSGTLDKGGG